MNRGRGGKLFSGRREQGRCKHTQTPTENFPKDTSSRLCYQQENKVRFSSAPRLGGEGSPAMATEGSLLPLADGYTDFTIRCLKSNCRERTQVTRPLSSSPNRPQSSTGPTGTASASEEASQTLAAFGWGANHSHAHEWKTRSLVLSFCLGCTVVGGNNGLL